MSVPAAGVVTALRPEGRSVERGARTRIAPRSPGTAHVIVGGIGIDNARRAAHRLVDSGARALVSWGCAGALSAELAAGDLCLPQTVFSMDGAQAPVDEGWHARARAALEGALDYHVAPLVCVDRVVATPGGKAELAHRFAGAIAIDMESSGVAQAAAERGVPFLIVRAIVDARAVSLPSSVLRAAEARGGVRLSRMVAHALLYPVDWPAHLALATGFRAALATLRRAARLLGHGLAFEAPTAGSAERSPARPATLGQE